MNSGEHNDDDPMSPTPVAGQPPSSLSRESAGGGSSARSAQYTEFEPTTSSTAEVSIGLLLDLTLPVSIELGRTSMSVQELLHLGRGSVLQLDRIAGEPIDIFVGDRRFAEGEVVVLGEHFGVRITQILASSASLNAGQAA